MPVLRRGIFKRGSLGPVLWRFAVFGRPDYWYARDRITVAEPLIFTSTKDNSNAGVCRGTKRKTVLHGKFSIPKRRPVQLPGSPIGVTRSIVEIMRS
jgi:hypothetical protein